jgi:hypothetical protein
MTAAQKQVLDTMDARSVGTIYVDSLSRWVWKCDIREDAQLAEAVIAWWTAPGVQI